MNAQLANSVSDCPCLPAVSCQMAAVCPKDATRVFKPKGTFIIFPGAKPLHVYFLHEGVVGMFRSWQSGEDTIANLYLPGTIFGLTSMLDDWGRVPGLLVWHARALTPSTVCQADPEAFLSYVSNDASRVRFLIEHNARQLRDAHRMAAIPMRHGPDKALAHVLAFLAEKASVRCQDGAMIPVRFTHQELADIARMTRATATRALHGLFRRGLIRMRQGRIIVLDIDALWEMTEEREDL